MKTFDLLNQAVNEINNNGLGVAQAASKFNVTGDQIHEHYRYIHLRKEIRSKIFKQLFIGKKSLELSVSIFGDNYKQLPIQQAFDKIDNLIDDNLEYSRVLYLGGMLEARLIDDVVIIEKGDGYFIGSTKEHE